MVRSRVIYLPVHVHTHVVHEPGVGSIRPTATATAAAIAADATATARGRTFIPGTWVVVLPAAADADAGTGWVRGSSGFVGFGWARSYRLRWYETGA